MASNTFSILILLVSLFLSQFSFSFGDNPTPIVHLINNLPPNHPPTMQVTCKLQHGLPLLSVTLVLGQDFPFDAGIINDIYVCYADWGILYAWFNAYDPLKEDKGQPIVYFSFRDRGIYKSYDKATWTGVTDWVNYAWLGARELSIEWADNPQHWTWNYIHNSGVEVVELLNVCWLDIGGKIDTSRLARKTSYSAYLVFKLKDNHCELERAIASVRFVKEKAEGTDEEGYTVFISKAKGHEGERGKFAYPRSDGWMEIKLGEFFNNFGEDGEVEMRLMENKNPNWKSGIIVKGIDIRPN